MTLETGELLRVRTFDRGVVERRFVRLSGDTAEVTTPEEWENASREGRSPICIGFPVTDVASASDSTEED
jgi:hypothetical protein